MSLPLAVNIYSRLFDHFGPQHWWPGETPDEVLAGCVLAQNTRWERVVPVIENLKRLNLLSPSRLSGIPLDRLAALLKGSGTYLRKAEYLKGLAEFFKEKGWTGDPSSMSHLATGPLRAELLALKGIGPETADCILLYVLGRPVFVVDAYTRRILHRHGMCGECESYDRLQGIFLTQLEPDPTLFSEFHAQLVVCAKTYCRPEPLCTECPLLPLLS